MYLQQHLFAPVAEVEVLWEFHIDLCKKLKWPLAEFWKGDVLSPSVFPLVLKLWESACEKW